MRLRAVKTLFLDMTMHVEQREGTRDQARDYCMKLDTRVSDPVEIGDFNRGATARVERSAKATRLSEFCDKLVAAPLTLMDLAMDDPATFCRNRNGIKDIANFALRRQGKTFRKVETIILWGDGGTGKTRWAMETYPDAFRVTQPDSQVWWDGYAGEKVILLDDFYGWIKWGQFLVLLDGYQLGINIKGSTTMACWDLVIITSNNHPSTWYEKYFLYNTQFSRRITLAYRVTLNELPGGPMSTFTAVIDGDKAYGMVDNQGQPILTPHMSSLLPTAPTDILSDEEATEVVDLGDQLEPFEWDAPASPHPLSPLADAAATRAPREPRDEREEQLFHDFPFTRIQVAQVDHDPIEVFSDSDTETVLDEINDDVQVVDNFIDDSNANYISPPEQQRLRRANAAYFIDDEADDVEVFEEE